MFYTLELTRPREFKNRLIKVVPLEIETVTPQPFVNFKPVVIPYRYVVPVPQQVPVVLTPTTAVEESFNYSPSLKRKFGIKNASKYEPKVTEVYAPVDDKTLYELLAYTYKPEFKYKQKVEPYFNQIDYHDFYNLVKEKNRMTFELLKELLR